MLVLVGATLLNTLMALEAGRPMHEALTANV